MFRRLFLTASVSLLMTSVSAAEIDATPSQAAQVSPLELLESRMRNGEVVLALMCFSSGERVSGMNKICYYDCAGSTAAITVSSVSLCPLSINN